MASVGNGSGAALVAAAAPEGWMKPVNLVAQLAAAETELAGLKMALAQVKEDRDELRQERDLTFVAVFAVLTTIFLFAL
jgi:hypothetical protein